MFVFNKSNTFSISVLSHPLAVKARRLGCGVSSVPAPLYVTLQRLPSEAAFSLVPFFCQGQTLFLKKTKMNFDDLILWVLLQGASSQCEGMGLGAGRTMRPVCSKGRFLRLLPASPNLKTRLAAL